MLRLPGVLDTDDISTLKRHFWNEVEQDFQIRHDDPATWFANAHNPVGDSRARRLAGMNPVMDRLRSSGRLSSVQNSLQATLDDLFGSRRWEPLDKWYSLLSFPGDQVEWIVPHNSWHNDEPIVVGDDEPWSIFAFVYLDRVERQTGPTLAITGSHRRGEILASQRGVVNEREVRAFENVNRDIIQDPSAVRLLPVGELSPALSASDEWFGAVVSGEDNDEGVEREQLLMSTGTSYQSIHSRVVDLPGDAGDVTLFDPRCLHSFSANTSDRPRQVLRLDFRRTAP